MDNNMKAEINNENKAKFFAQYWGQEVMRDYTTTRMFPVNGSNIKFEIEDAWLELKSLSEISDEDAIEVAKILDPDKSHGDWDQILEVKEDFVNIFSYNLGESIDDVNPVQFAQLSDFLRDRGYLVPWMGLSCEELIESGWVRYKE